MTDRLDPGRVDIWLFDRADERLDALADRGPVSDEEVARAEAMGDAARRRAMLARRAATRHVLATYVGTPPDRVRLLTAPGGKPVMRPDPEDEQSVAFSVSHSGELFCLAVGGASSVGVDVERSRDVPRAELIANRWFHDDERAAITATPGPFKSREFLRLWTAKEALAKRHSAGLRLLHRRDQEHLDVQWEEARECVRHFEPRSDYFGALASTAPIREIVMVTDPFDRL